MPLKTQFVASSDGVQIAYDVQGNGPVLCLLHGFRTNRAIWSENSWIERLQSQFTVVTLDLRGCGQSEAPLDPQAYSLQAHQADVETVMDANGVEKFLLWGWSFGATLGLHLAASSSRLEKAVIAGTYFGRIFTEEYVQQRLLQAHSPLLRARWQGLELWPSVEPHALRCPTFIYTGTSDGNVVVQLQRQSAAIEEAGLCLHVFDGFNHMQLVSMQDTVYEVVMPFLNAPAL